jgi:hypothetical protein
MSLHALEAVYCIPRRYLLDEKEEESAISVRVSRKGRGKTEKVISNRGRRGTMQTL